MAVNVWQKNTMTLQPDMDLSSPQADNITQEIMASEDGTDPNLALMQLRDTPLDSRTPSPGKLLQNWQLKTILPSIIRLAPNNEVVRASL